MLSKKMTAALNSQITAELYSSYLYLAMSAWLKAEGLPGAAEWMALQVREEAFHAQKLFNHILDRGGRVALNPIEAPAAKWKTAQEVFEAAWAHEQKVTALLNNLMNLARSENDHASELFLGWFITEQVEEEAQAQETAQKFKLAAGQGAALFLIDRELGARTLSPEVRSSLAG
jgi:ferritin